MNNAPVNYQALDKPLIEFKNVSFAYPDSEKSVLKNLNLTLRQGERLAVVGKNGSGKTTFVKLLCRLYDPVEGEILFNGKNIKEYLFAALSLTGALIGYSVLLYTSSYTLLGIGLTFVILGNLSFIKYIHSYHIWQ